MVIQQTSLCLLTFEFGPLSGKGYILSGPQVSLHIYFKGLSGPQNEENVVIQLQWRPWRKETGTEELLAVQFAVDRKRPGR